MKTKWLGLVFSLGLALSLISCDAAECRPEGELKCPPCTMCEGQPLDELTEEEKASYDTSWTVPPEWILGTWRGSFAGDENFPAFEIEASVTDSSSLPELGAHFFVIRDIAAGEGGRLCEGEAVQPCERIELPVLVDWKITSDLDSYDRRGRLLLEGSGKSVKSPLQMPQGYVSFYEQSKTYRMLVGFDPEGKLWLSAEDGTDPPVEIGAKETTTE